MKDSKLIKVITDAAVDKKSGKWKGRAGVLILGDNDTIQNLAANWYRLTVTEPVAQPIGLGAANKASPMETTQYAIILLEYAPVAAGIQPARTVERGTGYTGRPNVKVGYLPAVIPDFQSV